jgi:hypothetical protein
MIAFAVAEMTTCRRVTLGSAIITAIGVGLLADEQRRASDLGSLLLAGIGLGILFGLGRSGTPEVPEEDREMSGSDRATSAGRSERTGP